MLARVFFFVFVVTVAAWFLGNDVDTEHKVALAAGRVADANLTLPASEGGSQSSRSLFGQSASPFGRLDCDKNFQSTACNPDEIKDEISATIPVIAMVQRLSDEVKSGNYAAIQELTSNLRECSAIAAANANSVGIQLGYLQSLEEATISKAYTCDADISTALNSEVKSALNAAAQNGNMTAKTAYVELLKSDLLETIAALNRDKAKGIDSTTSKLKVVASKTEALNYLKSGNLNDQESKVLTANIEQLEAEP